MIEIRRLDLALLCLDRLFQYNHLNPNHLNKVPSNAPRTMCRLLGTATWSHFVTNVLYIHSDQNHHMQFYLNVKRPLKYNTIQVKAAPNRIVYFQSPFKRCLENQKSAQELLILIWTLWSWTIP